MKEPLFPWIINYYSDTEYYIHPYLNVLINNNKKRFACVFISLISDNYLHANVLLYDFKNKTVERFEPYGNMYGLDVTIDDILEEELTWNTGLSYKRPSDYLPLVSFQMISDENNSNYQKPGDFGGFCLAWCIWYVEHRLKNPDILPKVLVGKIIKKISNLNIKFIEYIRNYANKINLERIKYLTSIGIPEKNTSNVNMKNREELHITQYLIKSYSSIIN
jgi:hypothetical protein